MYIYQKKNGERNEKILSQTQRKLKKSLKKSNLFNSGTLKKKLKEH